MRAYLDVLRLIHDRLQDSGVPWAITGSVGFALQGVPAEPHDIDLQTDAVGAYEIERRLAEFVTQEVAFSSTDRIRSYFGALTIDGIRVEIMGDIQKRREDGSWEPSPALEEQRRFVEVEGMRIPVLSLEYEYQAYLKMGRIERARMLRQWLDAGGCPNGKRPL